MHSSPDPELTRLRRETQLLREQLRGAAKRHDTMTSTLMVARTELEKLKAEIASFQTPPHTFATVVHPPVFYDLGPACEVLAAGRRLLVPISTELEPDLLVPGTDVRLSESQVVIAIATPPLTGEVVAVHSVIDRGRILVGSPGDQELVFHLTTALRERGVREGDSVLVDRRSQFAFELVEKPENASLLLEEVPDISYSDIGGLAPQIELIHDAIELPFAHPQLYAEHGLKAPKGILLYGPPGCGKTLIAKAVARSLAARQTDPRVKSYFISVKGPELLDKYVGETERQLRLIFSRAREKADAGAPVVVFFDEMEALFRTRGSGRSSDVETTVVPQLLTEIDGVENLENVVIIGASNREDLIDPAILRPGRLDVKIRIERPDAQAAQDIFSKYITPQLPLHADATPGGTAELIERCVDSMFAHTPENEFIELEFANGSTQLLYFGDFASGAMISNIVDRAKKHAIKDVLSTGERGLHWEHFNHAIREEFSEHEDLPNTANPDEWSRIIGHKGERVVDIRSLARTRSRS